MIHRWWEGPPPPFEPWLGRLWGNLGNELIDHTDLEPDLEALLDRCSTQVAPDQLHRHRSNIVRYWLLHRHGGIWADHDVIPLTRLDLPLPFTATIGTRREGCVLGFPAGHEMLKELLVRIGHMPSSGSASPQVSGADMLNAVATNYPDVTREPRVVGADAQGRPTCREPLAMHLWLSTSSRHLTGPVV